MHKTWLRAVFACAVFGFAAGLAGCGGSSEADRQAEALAAIEHSAAQWAGVEPRRTHLVAAAAESSVDPLDSATQLMEFAEAQFPQYFPGPQATRALNGWYYRYYARSGVYLAVIASRIYVLGGAFGTEVFDAGPLTTYLTPRATMPVAQAGGARQLVIGRTITLDGSASSDPNGDALTYNWRVTSQPVGSQPRLERAATATPTFTADVAGFYEIALVVSDGHLASTASTAIVTVVGNAVPVAVAGSARTVSVGSLVSLDGSASSDANGDTLGYAWTLGPIPAGSKATLADAQTARPFFTADVAGTYTASLTVSDGQANSTTSTVVITATTAPQFDGTWSGTTGQGRAFSFTVEGGKISKVTVSFSASNCGTTGDSTTTFSPAFALQGSTIAYTAAADLIRSWTGTFASGTQASGDLRLFYQSFAPFICSQSINTTWTATKG